MSGMGVRCHKRPLEAGTDGVVWCAPVSLSDISGDGRALVTPRPTVQGGQRRRFRLRCAPRQRHRRRCRNVFSHDSRNLEFVDCEQPRGPPRRPPPKHGRTGGNE